MSVEALRSLEQRYAMPTYARAPVEFVRGEPVLDNDAGLSAATAPLLDEFGFKVSQDLRSAGSDDFSYFSERMPSLMQFVGTH